MPVVCSKTLGEMVVTVEIVGNDATITRVLQNGSENDPAFDIRGAVIQAPAPRALDLFEVRIENRIVKVNTANVARRRRFDSSQVTRP